MEREIYVIMVAGGSGARMGADIPKQFLDLGGRPILRRSIELMTTALPSAKIITVLPKEYVSYWEDYCLKSNFSVPQMVVKGGITRFHSVKNALAKVPDGAIVAVHDAVRPLVSAQLVQELVRQAAETGSAIPVVPAVDTLRVLKNDDGRLSSSPETLDRSRIYAVQTPQVFHSEILSKAYEQAFDTAFTDDASVVERNKIPLSYVLGERFNIKITTAEDLFLAKAIIQKQD